MTLKFVSAPPYNPRRCLSTHYYQEEDDNTIRANSDPEIRSPPPRQQRTAEEEKNDCKKLALLKNVSSLLMSQFIMTHRDLTVAQG